MHILKHTSYRSALSFAAIFVAFAVAPQVFAQATSSSDTVLRATIQAEITADPRAQNLTPAQMNAMVDALTAQAEEQGVTASQLTFRPQEPQSQSAAAPTTSSCTQWYCAFSSAFGLDGSYPLIPIGLFIAAVLFILIFSIMREMGHPHTQFVEKK